MESNENTIETVDLVAMARAKKQADFALRRCETWGGKQLRRFKLRTIVQLSMIILCSLLALQFYRFVHAAFTTTTEALPSRPSGVDGFLPITGLMGTVDWIAQGSLNTIHPAATILLLTFILISIIWRKAFCSWLCPVGTISENLALLGRKLFGRNLLLWHWLDVALRSLKYILLAFFVGSIFYMGIEGSHAFLYSEYNHVADIKMGMFFIRLGGLGLGVIAFLLIGSIFINGLWCRYLCPYGALLGLFSWLSPTKVQRSAPDCIDCGLCDNACPARLPVMSKAKIISVECTGCFDCVASCPVPAALNVKTSNKNPIPIKQIAIAITATFVGIWLLAQAFGVWNNSISDDQYRKMIPEMDQFGHPGR